MWEQGQWRVTLPLAATFLCSLMYFTGMIVNTGHSQDEDSDLP